MATPTGLVDSAAVTARTAEVPGEAGITWTTGMNTSGANAPGIGINMDEGEVVGTAEQFTLLDQDGDTRIPQVSGVIGHDGFVNRAPGQVEWPGSGGVEGKATDALQDFNMPANVGGAPDNDAPPVVKGPCNLVTLAAGWGNSPTVITDPTIVVRSSDDQQATLGFDGLWPEGTTISVNVGLFDPQGTADDVQTDIVLPPGAPPEGWSAATVAQVYAGEVDALPHIQAVASGTSVVISIVDADYTLGNVTNVIG